MWAFWAASRVVLLALVFAGRVLGAQQGVLGDIRLYDGWGEAFVHGHGLPVGDETWQYPPAAILVFAVPALAHALTGLSYRAGFPLLMLAVDAAVTAVLARAGRARAGAATSSVDPSSVGPTPSGSAVSSAGPVSSAGAVSSAGSVSSASPTFSTGSAPAAGSDSSVRLAPPAGREMPGPAARVWLIGTFLLGPVTLARFDLVPAACIIVGLLALGARRPGWAGFAATVGTLVKVWPAFLLVALGRPSARTLARLAAGAAGAAAVVGLTLVAAGAGGDLLGFLGAQQSRGLQLEAVPATAFVIVRMFGTGETARYSYGSLQFGDSTARTVATVCTVVELMVVVAVVARWWLSPARADHLPDPDRDPDADADADPDADAYPDLDDATAASSAADTPVSTAHIDSADSADTSTASAVTATAGSVAADRPAVVACDRLLALLLVVLMTSRVLSPQYLIWVLAVSAAGVALAGRAGADVPAGDAADVPAGGAAGIGGADRERERRRRVGLVLLLVAVAVSQLIYPWRYNDVIQGRIVMSLVLAGRNVLLLLATWQAVRVSLTRPAGVPGPWPWRRRP